MCTTRWKPKVTSNKGELFQTRQSGREELDKKTLETRMVECEKTSYELRDEVKAAIGQGVEARIMACNSC